MDSSTVSIEDRYDDSESDTGSAISSVMERLSLLEQRVDIQRDLLKQLRDAHERTSARMAELLDPLIDLVSNANQKFTDLQGTMETVLERLTVLETDVGVNEANVAACSRIVEQRGLDQLNETNPSTLPRGERDILEQQLESDMRVCIGQVELLEELAD